MTPVKHMTPVVAPRIFMVIGALAVSAALGCSKGGPVPSGGTASGAELFQLCAQCHGAHGEGSHEFSAPAIAGLDEWYVKRQLEHFKSGVRGAHPDDANGLRMRPMALSLRNDVDLASVAAYTAKLPRAKPESTVKGDAANGQALFATCSACHGADGRGNEAMKAPPLANSNDWYLLAQLGKFRAGIRGTNPEDVGGVLMRPMAMTLPDAQAMKDVIAYAATLK